MLPRDNKMFFITETMNLEKSIRNEPDLVDKLNHYDNVKEILRMLKRADHMSMNSSIQTGYQSIGNVARSQSALESLYSEP
jgi:hypothetical protein